MHKTTQGRRLIAALKRRPMTYGAMQALGISTSPQKRIVEALAWDEKIVKSKGADGLVRWRVVKLLWIGG
jgi:hypothetical protein